MIAEPVAFGSYAPVFAIWVGFGASRERTSLEVLSNGLYVVGTRVLLPIKDRLYLWALVGLDLNEAWQRLGDLQDMFWDGQNNPLFPTLICTNHRGHPSRL